MIRKTKKMSQVNYNCDYYLSLLKNTNSEKTKTIYNVSYELCKDFAQKTIELNKLSENKHCVAADRIIFR